jgi:hypothetical protein
MHRSFASLDFINGSAPTPDRLWLLHDQGSEKEPNLKIIGCDFHPSYQQIAMVEEETGEWTERRLLHADGEAQRFYESLRGPVRVGLEAEGGGGKICSAGWSSWKRKLPPGSSRLMSKRGCGRRWRG